MLEFLLIAGFFVLAVLIVLLNDKFKRKQPVQSGVHKLRDLNQPLGFYQKLWTTFLLLIFALLITPLMMIGLDLMKDPIIHGIVEHILETIGVFYALLLVYIWWRPRWLFQLYYHAEKKLVFMAYLVGGLIFVISFIVFLANIFRKS